MNITEALDVIEQAISDPKVGLPEEIFKLISRLTPMVNVDLLVKDTNQRTLLAWRDDEYSGTGWHIPGGIVRFKESLENRIQQVAISELKTEVRFNPNPISLNQAFCNPDTRGHFISLLYKCTVNDDFQPDNTGTDEAEPGYLTWHNHCPDNLIQVHDMYREYIAS